MICKNFHQLLHFLIFLILFELILNSFNSLNIFTYGKKYVSIFQISFVRKLIISCLIFFLRKNYY